MGFRDGVLALALAVSFKKKRKSPRKWMKGYLRDRYKFSNQNLLRELRNNEPEDFKNFLRMDSSSFDELLEMVSPHIKKMDTNMRTAISPQERLTITLRYLATGSTFRDSHFQNAVSRTSVSRIVLETCEAIILCLKEYIQLPRTEHEWKLVAEQFEKKWNFVHGLGALDGKHIKIIKPPDSGSFYFNYQKTYSIVLMCLADANYRILMADVGVNGRVSDGGVLGYTEFGRLLNSHSLNLPPCEKIQGNDKVLPYTFVADDAFALSENMMKPYSLAGAKLTDQQRIFNYRLSRARRIVENVFGILASRFRVLQNEMLVSPEKSRIITLACCYLHNFLRSKVMNYLNEVSVDYENVETGEIREGSWRSMATELTSLQPSTSKNASTVAKSVRDNFCEYFNAEGAVPWQIRHING